MHRIDDTLPEFDEKPKKVKNKLPKNHLSWLSVYNTFKDQPIAGNSQKLQVIDGLRTGNPVIYTFEFGFVKQKAFDEIKELIPSLEELEFIKAGLACVGTPEKIIDSASEKAEKLQRKIYAIRFGSDF